jgi:phosphoribosyl 1,2-cyclic phosphodiesterase/CheY-like chemotaxis protein
MTRNLSCYVVDDSPDFIKLAESILKTKGYDVAVNTSSINAYGDIINQKPDIVILDIMMPVMDGLELCKRLRANEEMNNSKIIIVSAKPYEYDKQRAFSFGADGYITKPITPKNLIKEIEDIALPKITLTFWGVRGTLPMPGKNTLKYGGNTSCVSIAFPGDRFFIFDAGSGIKELSNYLLSIKKAKFKANIFISHPHWDHINGLPFFAPLYMQGNEFEICGTSHGDIKMRQVISSQMEGIYFPITIREFGARVYFKDLVEDSYIIDNISVKTKLLVHPGYDLGYRIDYKDKSICYVTDNELYLPESPYYSQFDREHLISFIKGSDILMHECTYFDEEYLKKMQWGHSCVSQIAEMAHNADVKDLYIFHHDPDHTDDHIERKVDLINKILIEKNSTTKCFAAVEQQEVILKLNPTSLTPPL